MNPVLIVGEPEEGNVPVQFRSDLDAETWTVIAVAVLARALLCGANLRNILESRSVPQGDPQPVPEPMVIG